MRNLNKFLIVLLASASIISCKKEVVDPEVMVATSIELVSGGDQSATIETTLAKPLVVMVTDQDGNAFAGTTVNFTVADGSVSSATGITDSKGKASINWTLGTTLGEQNLIVTAFEADGTSALAGSPLNIKATGIAPKTLVGVWDFTNINFLGQNIAGDGSYLQFNECDNIECRGVDFKASDTTSGSFTYTLYAEDSIVIVDNDPLGGNYNNTWIINKFTVSELTIEADFGLFGPQVITMKKQ